MKRRVIKQGTSTLTVSLPAKWIKTHGIKPGDEVDVTESGMNLVLGKGNARTEKKAELNIEGMKDRLVFRHMNVLYTQGFDEINVFFGDPKRLEMVQHALSPLIGYTIVEQKPNSCVVKEIVETRGEDFDRILKRVFVTVEDVSRDSVVHLKEKDWKSLEGIKQRDRDVVNKLAFFCLRILNKEGYVNPEKTQALRDFVIILESISDEYSNFSEELAHIHKPVSKAAIERITEVNSLLLDVERLYYTFDRNEMFRLHERCRTLRFDISKAAKAMSREDFIALYHVRKIAEWLLAIIESIIALNIIGSKTASD